MVPRFARGERAATAHAVVVGAGFAGLQCAQRLSRDRHLRITLIDKNNFHVFHPLLYQIGTGLLSPNNASFNLRALLHRYPNIELKMSEVIAVNLATRTVYGKSGDAHQGDYLVLAAGAEANFLDVPGAETHTMPLYSLKDAQRLRRRLITIFEAAELTSMSLANQPLDIVVIGGGATGVEIGGALADLAERTPRRLFRSFDLRCVRITIVEGGNTVLAPFREKSQQYAITTLRARGVQFRFGSQVREVTSSEVLLADGSQLPSTITIWAGGLKAARLSASLGLAAGRGGRVNVQPDLSVAGFPGVYALGDFSNCAASTGEPLPQLASVAKQAGGHCAANILAHRRGAAQRPFTYLDSGIMAMVGRNAAVAEIGRRRHVLLGPLAFIAWLSVHVLLLNTVWAKLQTLLEWMSEYIGHVNMAAILDQEDSV